MANVTSEAVLPASLDLTIGAEFIGLTVALLLYGASTGQLFWYFRKSEGLNVTGWMVYYIVMLWSLGTLQVILTSYLLATYLVLGRGNLVAVFGSVKVYAVSVMVSDFTSSMVRYGYLYRIWKFTHKRFLICLALCTVLTTLTLGVSLYFGVVLVRSDFLWQVSFRDLTWSYFVAFGAQVIVDLMIAFVVFSSFLKFCTGIQRFDMLIRTIMIFVLSTGALAVAFTTGGIIVFVALPRTYVFNGMFWTYCQLHICSFLAVLNTEKELARRTLTHRLARATVQLTTRVDVGSFADTPPPSIGGEAAYGAAYGDGYGGYAWARRGSAMGTEAGARKGKGVEVGGVEIVDRGSEADEDEMDEGALQWDGDGEGRTSAERGAYGRTPDSEFSALRA